jgi:hypothetical protein
MPGLSGIVGPMLRRRAPEEVIRTFKGVGAVQGVSYIHREFVSEDASILNSLTGIIPGNLSQPAMDRPHDLVLFLEGEIYNVDDLAGYLQDRRNRSVLDLLLALYEVKGEDFVTLLNGEFNILIYSKARKQLSIFCDHMASMPMYYVEQNGSFIFGSEKKYILSVMDEAPKMDGVGLLQIFAHRYNLDDRTYIEGIKRMMPGTKLVFREGRLKEEQYHQLRFTIPRRAPPVSDLVRQWGDRLEQATWRRVRNKDRVLISLSAGLDSRAIACAIPRDFRPIVSRTRGVDESLEARYASEIAGQLNFEHFREEPGSMPYSTMIPRIAWRTECETHFLNAVSITSHRAVKEHADHIAGGWLGDVSSGGHISVDLLQPLSRSSFIERAFNRHVVYGEDQLARVFSTEFLKAHFSGVREAFHQSFVRLEGETNMQAYEIWDIYQRQRRQTTSSMPIDSYLFEKVRPFYDKEYLEFTLTLPLYLRFGQSLYQSMIYEIGPEIRHIPCSNNQLRLHSSIAGNLFNKGVTLAHRATSRQIRRIRPNFRNTVEQRAIEDPAMAIRSDSSFRRLIVEFLESDDFDTAVFNKQGISNLLHEHYESVRNHADLLGYVATMAAGLPYFLNKTLQCPEEAQPLGG